MVAVELVDAFAVVESVQRTAIVAVVESVVVVAVVAVAVDRFHLLHSYRPIEKRWSTMDRIDERRNGSVEKLHKDQELDHASDYKVKQLAS